MANQVSWDGGFKRAIGDESLGRTLALALDNATKQLHICDIDNAGADWARAASTNPEVCIHSATTPATDYIAIYHDATDANINCVGATALNILIGGTAEVEITASALSPGVTDSSALGTTSLLWSDLFLATGALIRGAEGDNKTIAIAVGSATGSAVQDIIKVSSASTLALAELGFYNKTPVAQAATQAQVGADTTTAALCTAVNALLTMAKNVGLMAS